MPAQGLADQQKISASAESSSWRNNPSGLWVWRRVLTECVRNDTPDLSARQMALLLTAYMDEREHTVRGLSAHLRISKPAISRALDRLGELGYIQRQRDDRDRRSVLVMRTAEGEKFLNEFSGLLSKSLKLAAAGSFADDGLSALAAENSDATDDGDAIKGLARAA